jgi:hypothetical protein
MCAIAPAARVSCDGSCHTGTPVACAAIRVQSGSASSHVRSMHRGHGPHVSSRTGPTCTARAVNHTGTNRRTPTGAPTSDGTCPCGNTRTSAPAATSTPACRRACRSGSSRSPQGANATATRRTRGASRPAADKPFNTHRACSSGTAQRSAAARAESTLRPPLSIAIHVGRPGAASSTTRACAPQPICRVVSLRHATTGLPITFGSMRLMVPPTACGSSLQSTGVV